MLEAKTIDAPNLVARPKLLKSKSQAETPLSKLLVDGVIAVTPELAHRIIMNCGYEKQRPIRGGHVEVLASQMRRREFTPGTQLHFARLPDDEMVLLNGNHRTHAVAKADTTVAFQILVTDVPNYDALRTLYRRHDRTTANRTISDALFAEGIGERHGLRKEISAATFRAMSVIGNRFQGHNKAAAYFKSDEFKLAAAEDWWPVAELFQDAIVKAPVVPVKNNLQKAGVCAVALMTFRHQEAKADAFWRGIANNDGLFEGDPRRAYLTYLATRPRAGGSEVQTAKAAAVAWNAFFRDRKLHIVRLHSGPVVILGTPFARPPKD